MRILALVLMLFVACGLADPVSAGDAPARSPTPATIRAMLRPTADPALSLPAAITMLPTPAKPGSGEPSLSISPEGVVWLSWIDPSGTGHALRAARLEETGWSPAVTIVEGGSLVANGADFPTVLPLGRGHLVAHWPWQHGASPHAYDVRVSQSFDHGATWGSAVVPHRDSTDTEHGFVSMTPEGDGTRLFWLDGRDFAHAGTGDDVKGHDGHEADGEMALRTAWLGPDGRIGEETLLDGRVCDCCQTTAARIAGGFVVAYRDRDSSDVRDISAIRFGREGWSEPQTLWPDHWRVPGCPVNGPALDGLGNAVAAAWYTASGDSERVMVSISLDGGRNFREPTQIDEGSPLGRVSVALLEDGSAIATWLEGDRSSARVMARWVRASGAYGPAVAWARTPGTRVSGFPRLLRAGDQLVLTWTEVGKTAVVRTAKVPVPR